MSESTVIVALITALSAILAPLASTYITNIVQARNRRNEILYNNKFEAFKDFTNKAMIYINEYIANNYCDNLSSINKQNFLTSYQTAFLICDTTTRNRMYGIDLYDNELIDGKYYAQCFLNSMKGITMAMNEEILEHNQKSDNSSPKKYKKYKS